MYQATPAQSTLLPCTYRFSLSSVEHFWKLDSISANQGREERRLIEISSLGIKNQAELVSRQDKALGVFINIPVCDNV